MVKKIVSILVMIALSLLVVFGAKEYKKSLKSNINEDSVEEVSGTKDEVVLWYSYEYYGEYLTQMAEKYKKLYNSDINITIKHVSGTNMLEAIAKANETGEGLPDLYITGSENLEKAYLMGLCKENTNSIYTEEKFASQALNAAKYKDTYYAYPLGFETAAFVYNKKYVTEEPATFDDIKEYADNFNSLGEEDIDENDVSDENSENGVSAGEESTEEPVDYSVVESILVWDADSMLYNYGFIGKYISFSGYYADNNITVDVDEERLISSLQYYKELYNYFALANEADNYDKIVDDFAQGKIVFSIMDIESLRILDESNVEYGVCRLPQLSVTLGSKMLALTDLVVVNPYADDVKEAEEFAVYLTNNATYSMYDMIGLLPARKLKTYDNLELREVADQYKNTTSLPSSLVFAEYWLKVENLFRDINKSEDEEIETIIKEFVADIKK